jgi:hypothetical protein
MRRFVESGIAGLSLDTIARNNIMVLRFPEAISMAMLGGLLDDRI